MEDAAFGFRSCIIISRKEIGESGILHFVHGRTRRPENLRVGLAAFLPSFGKPVWFFDKFFSRKAFYGLQQIFGHDFQIA